jgi:ApaG protein
MEKYSETTSGVQITVMPEFIADQSDVDQGRFVYSYTILMKNARDSDIQLINRHWIVFSGGKQIADVKGEGVVGKQPVLKPGESFHYTSGTVVRDSVGSMVGTFTFVDKQGTFFDVAIPRFHLMHADSHVMH